MGVRADASQRRSGPSHHDCYRELPIGALNRMCRTRPTLVSTCTALLLSSAVTLAVLVRRAEPLRAQASNAEARAVTFLTREVPRWKSENDCYSCHNNGDAARALLVA